MYSWTMHTAWRHLRHRHCETTISEERQSGANQTPDKVYLTLMAKNDFGCNVILWVIYAC